MGINSRSFRLRLSLQDLVEWAQEANPEIGKDSDQFGRKCVAVRHEQLRGCIDWYWLKPGLRISSVDLYVDRDTELVAQLDEPAVAFGLLLDASGTRAVTNSRGVAAEVQIRSRLNLVSVVQGKEWLLRLAGNRRHRMFRVYVEKRLLPELIQGGNNSVAEPLRHMLSLSSSPKTCLQKDLSPAGEYLAHQVLRCPLEGVARRLFMESKALEMLAYELEEFSNHSPGKAAMRDAQEVERLYCAKSILEAEFTNPPSLFQLSRRAGLNDFKLKAGFRDVFGTTVFGYVRQLRMEKARSLLEGTDLSVTEIALVTGYSSFGHFAATFKESFGILPSQYRRVRPRPFGNPNDPSQMPSALRRGR